MDYHEPSKRYLTLYHKPKAPSGTLFIQAEKSRHFLNVGFVTKTLPIIYAEVVYKQTQLALENKKTKQPASKFQNVKKQSVKSASTVKKTLKSPPTTTEIKKDEAKDEGDLCGSTVTEEIISADENIPSSISLNVTSSKPFSCNICDDKFSSAYHLEYHMNCCHVFSVPQTTSITRLTEAAIKAPEGNPDVSRPKILALVSKKRKRGPDKSTTLKCEECESNIEKLKHMKTLEKEHLDLKLIYENQQRAALENEMDHNILNKEFKQNNDDLKAENDRLTIEDLKQMKKNSK